MKQKVTMKDVARRAGVSTATVSYVLNNSSQVGEETRDHVLKVVEQMSYQRNTIAKTLRTAKSATIGVIVEDMTVFNSPRIIDGINEFTEQQGYHIVLSNMRLNARIGHNYTRLADMYDVINDAVEVILNRQVDGVVYIGEHTRDVTGLISTADKPCVYTYCYTQDPNDYTVNYDDRAAAYTATSHLMDAGHRRIAVITGLADSIPTRERLGGYTAAINDAGLTIRNHYLAEADWEYDTGYRRCRELLALPEPPTAIFAMNDVMAVGAIDAARSLGLVVPRDLSVIGFDNREFTAYCDPRISTMDLPLREMGAAAAELLLNLVKGKTVKEHTIFLPCTLIQRSSTDRAARESE